MYKIFILLIAFITLNIVAEQANVTSNVSTDDSRNITTLEGITYKNCEVIKIWPNGIKIFHSKGIALIPFTDLSNKDKKEYGYNPKKAEEFRKKQAIKAEELRNEKAALIKKEEKKKEKIKKEEERKKEQAILKEIEETKWRQDFLNSNEKDEPVFDSQLRLGQTSKFDGSIKTIQIVDNNNLIANIPYSTTKYRRETYYPLNCGRKPVASSRLVSYKATAYKLVWLSGVPTAGMVDDQLVKLPGKYTVARTKTYQITNGGSKTVFVLEPAKPPMEKKAPPVSKVPTQTNDSQPETTPQLIKTEQQPD